MKRLNSKLKPIAFATLTALALSAPIAAQAEVSAGISLATMYLWRGQDVSNSAPEISGSLDYSHSSGFYAGMWTSSEAPGHSYEQDLYVGYAKSFGDFGIDLAIYEFLPSGTDRHIDVGAKTSRWIVARRTTGPTGDDVGLFCISQGGRKFSRGSFQ